MPRGHGNRKSCFEKKYGIPPSALRVKMRNLPSATPVLKGKDAEKFLKMMEDNENKKVGPVPTPKLKEAVKMIENMKSESMVFINQVIGYYVCPECGYTVKVYQVSVNMSKCFCYTHQDVPMVFLKVLPKMEENGETE